MIARSTAPLLRALQAHDPATLTHCFRVRDHALALADVLGLPGRQRQRLRLASELHDLGKLGVPLAILNKQFALTPAERAVIETHPARGEELLAGAVGDPEVRAAVRHHHERYDGSGYPDRLAGDGIPLLARLLSVADCFDALTSDRPYRQGLPAERALEILRGDMGTGLDPEAVLAFHRVPGVRRRAWTAGVRPPRFLTRRSGARPS